MRKQDFYGLPRSIQDRFIESSQAVAAPAPLAVAPVGEKRSMIWGAGTVLCGAAWGGFISLGMGDLYSAFALTSPAHKAVHVVFAGLLTACALRAYSLSWAARKIPYGSGHYLFPFGVVTAREECLIEYDSAELESVTAVGPSVQVNFKGGHTFAFPTGAADAAKRVVEAVQAGAEKWKEVTDAEPLKRARFNPLLESGVPNPLAPTQPHQRPILLPIGILAAIVAVGGLVFGLGAASWRDTMSRKTLYKTASEADTVEAYRAYLARGGEREEVESLQLPRAELKGVVKEGTVQAIVDFQKKNPKSKIVGEVQQALRDALLGELEAAKAKGTITAIDEVPKKFQEHELIGPEIAAARSAVFAKVLAELQAGASDADPGLLPFVHKLFTYAQAHGSRVEVRFEHDFPQDPAMLDKIVSKSEKYYMGRKSLPTQYFLGDAARRREKAALTKIAERLQKAFPKDIVEVQLGAVPRAENERLPEIKVPTITFSHQERLSGGFVGGKPKAMFLGAAIMIKAQAKIPGSEETLVFTWNSWRSPQFSILADKNMDIPDIYEDMMGGAFNEFATLYLARWFKKP